MQFLKAEWRDLIMLNWEIDPKLLTQYIPSGTSLDLWQGKAFVSLVGFNFLNTRVLGLPIPYHVNFEEINLRFYVKREIGSEIRRGVVFIKEIVPRFFIAFTARLLYNENYVAMKTASLTSKEGGLYKVRYEWQAKVERNYLSVCVNEDFKELVSDSLEAFIAEHYWGYGRQRGGQSLEYRVNHSPWSVATAKEIDFSISGSELYGDAFGEILKRRPDSAFIADGSPVTVGFGDKF